MSFGAPNFIPSASAGRRLSTLSSESLSDPAFTGATAQTSGFAQAGDNPSAPSAVPASPTSTSTLNKPSSPGLNSRDRSPLDAFTGRSVGFGGGFGGGGLQSSPNVPAPGTSINPATGKPHTAGLTRAELEAIRAKGADLLDPSPQSEQARRGSSNAAVSSDLSGREQAAIQLSGTATGAALASDVPERPAAERQATKELPGGYGPVPQVPIPGATGSNTTSVYEDVNEVLAKVGTTAFNVLPASLKNALSSSPSQSTNTGLAPQPTSPTNRRSSVAAIFDTVKARSNSIVEEFRENYTSPPSARRDSAASQTVVIGDTGRRGSSFIGDGTTLNKVRDFLADAWVPPHLSQTQPVAAGNAPAKTLPSEETQGAKPGESSDGVGALPGKVTEAGVAVLPEEKSKPSSSALENQGFRPGEVPVAPVPANTSGSGPDVQKDVKAEDTGAPLDKAPEVIPAPPATEHDSHSAPTATLATAAGVGAGALAGAGLAAHDSETASSKALDSVKTADEPSFTSSGTGLAAPLPHTTLGQGADAGATDVGALSGIVSDKTDKAATNDDITTSSSTTVPSLLPGNDRTSSLASVTAIRHGHEGDRPHASSPLSAVSGANETSGYVKSLAPGAEADGVGHPSTRDQDGTTREPGSYPAAEHDGKIKEPEYSSGLPVVKDSSSTPSSTNSKPTTTGGNVDTSSTPNTSTQTKSPTTSTHHDSAVPTTDKHHRTSSASSNGKKKAGFMNKLKGEMKVISGKIGGDEAKVQEGERLKHGGGCDLI